MTDHSEPAATQFITRPSTEFSINSGQILASRKDDVKISEENHRFRTFLEKKAGSRFVEKAEALFKSKGLGFDIKLFEQNLNDHLIDWRDYLHGIKVEMKIYKNRSKADILREHK
jgi:hypothetical protein